MCQRRTELSVSSVIGGGYNRFWRCKKPYRVLMGGRGSKKSTTTALNLIVRMMQYPLANVLCIRQIERDLQQSCYAQLIWAIKRLGVESQWKCTVSPLRLEYIPTGQKILFRGLDKWSSVTSMTVDTGFLCWCWVEEAYEVDKISFQSLDESIRGIMPEGYFTQITLTFNPWDASCWIKSTFFDVPREDTLAMVTTYRCNEWLSDVDREKYESLKFTDPDRYKVVALGEWGLPQGQFFSQWRDGIHVIDPFDIPDRWLKFRSMDWGCAKPFSCHWYAVDYDNNLYMWRELYGWSGAPNEGTGETARQVADRLVQVESKAENISYGVLDSACWANTGVTGPTIAEEINDVLYQHNLVTFGKCSKGRIEAANAIKERLVGNKQEDGTYRPALFVFRNCIHAIRTIPMLGHDKRKPETYDTDGEDHAADDLGYACLSRPWTPSRPRKARPVDAWEEKQSRSAWTY